MKKYLCFQDIWQDILTFCWQFIVSDLSELFLHKGVIVSEEMISDRFSYCREVFMSALGKIYEDDEKTGGPGEEFEVDECLIGRMKNNKGRVVEGS